MIYVAMNDREFPSEYGFFLCLACGADVARVPSLDVSKETSWIPIKKRRVKEKLHSFWDQNVPLDLTIYMMIPIKV